MFSYRFSKHPDWVMQIWLSCAIFFYLPGYFALAEHPPTDNKMPSNPSVKTCFQTASEWLPELDLVADAAIIYGVNPTFAKRSASWRERGYEIQFMTGAAWGGYQDYFEGRFDGQTHFDEGQVNRDGQTIWHGPGVPYVVPTAGFLNYLKEIIKVAVDSGATTIHLEEPEFWNRAGYSEGFKREWLAFYGTPWQPQHESPAATYQSNKLKHFLYVRALRELIEFTHSYAVSKGRLVKCFVPTHSLLNYSAWKIVSPEASLAHIPGLDGYVGQVWTGTARTPIYYEGVCRERTFEAAYLEYSSLDAMTRPTGKQVYFLTDPIEDDPDYSWENYKKNYEDTFVAQLLFPQISQFEVLPWPRRIFLGKYKVENRDSAEPIPADYATEILVLINSLNQMQQTQIKFPGTHGIAVVQSNSLMFQSFPEHADYQDPRLSNFYGMALPLVKHGIPVQLVQLEHLEQPGTLENVQVLLLSYANMKPLKPEYHRALAEWVRRGGRLIYLGRDDDPFQRVPEWWNSNNHYPAPSAHLFEALGLSAVNFGQPVPVEKGAVLILRQNPAEFVLEPRGAELRKWVAKMVALDGSANLDERNYFHLTRGPYEIIAVLDESISEQAYEIRGNFIDLFDSALPVIQQKIVHPGERVLLYNLDARVEATSMVPAAASRVVEEKFGENLASLTLRGPAATNGIAKIKLPRKPTRISIKNNLGDEVGQTAEWLEQFKLLAIKYPNLPEGIRVTIELN
jgi:hypothetical protein